MSRPRSFVLLALAALLTTGAVLAAVPVPAAAVVGGRPATEGYEWLVAIGWDGEFACAGNVIGARTVLTAAGCVTDPTTGAVLPAAKLTAVVGRPDRSDGTRGRVIGVARVHRHEHWAEPEAYSNDLAVIELQEGAAVAPIQIAESGADDALWAADAQVRVIGWGNAEPFGAPTSRDGLSDTLHEAEIPVVADAQCARAHPWGAIGAPGFDPATMLCAGETHGTEGPCDGDAGGPLVARRPAAGTAVLVGTVSWGMGCGLPAQPDVFARVGEAALGRWIRHHLASPSADAPAADLAGASGRPRAPARMTIGRVRRKGRVLVVQVVVSSSVRGARVAVYRGSRRLATTPGSGRLHAGSHRLALRLPAAAASGRLELVASARVGSRKLLARRRVWIGR